VLHNIIIMKHIAYLLLLTTNLLLGQVGIGTTTPRGGLEVSSNSGGGILIPQYALTGSNDNTTVSNPQGGALVDGTLVYNTATITGVNSISPGFLYWNGSSWSSIAKDITNTQIMLRKFTSSTIVTSGDFNFPEETFSNIDGASYSSNTITLPTGVYIVESNIMTADRYVIYWDLRLDGVDIDDVGGSTSNYNYSPNSSYAPLISVFEITAATGDITFEVTFYERADTSVNPSVIASRSFVKIEKIQ